MVEFEREATTLQGLNHPNIVHFLGIYCTSRSGVQEKFIVTEFMMHGSLDLLLRDKNIEGPELLSMYVHKENKMNNEFRAKDASAGMKYLSDGHIVHRDLALRNLLVTSSGSSKYLVKIADFGMSRNMQSDYYTSSDMQMPVKWSPPEVLSYGKYSTQSGKRNVLEVY